jgi:plasmid stabilization system protein ParE
VAGWRLTQVARRDVDEIARFVVRRDGVDAAETVLRRLYSAFDELARRPVWGKESPLHADVTVRERIVLPRHGGYWVLYKVGPQSIVILRVVPPGRPRPTSVPPAQERT